MSAYVSCPACSGYGWTPGLNDEEDDCEECGGTGEVEDDLGFGTEEGVV